MPSELERRESWKVSYVDPESGKKKTKSFRSGGKAVAKRNAEELAAQYGDAKVKHVTSYRTRVQLKTGEVVRKTFEKRKHAKAWIQEAAGRKRRNKVIEPSKELLEVYLQRWLTLDAEGGELRANTAQQYRYSLEHYVIPYLGKIPIGDLAVEDIKSRYKVMREQGLSRRTVQLTNAVLHAALSDAETDGLLLFNPAAAALKKSRRNKENSGSKGKKRKLKAMLPEQVAAFLDAAKGDTHEILLKFLVLTGCRPSEAFALQWGDVDFRKGVVKIRRSLMRVKGSWAFEGTKTDGSVRAIPLSDGLSAILRQHRKDTAKIRLRGGLDLVFPGPDGTPLDISAVRRRHFNEVCARAGLADVIIIPAKPKKKGASGPAPKPKKHIKPWFTLYSLRHTAATLLARAGTAPKVAAAVLGHADVATTLKFYTHSAPDLEKEAIDGLANIVKIDEKGPRKDPETGSRHKKALRKES